MGAQFLNMPCYVGGHRTLDCTWLTTAWHMALERTLGKSHHPLDEIAEDIRQVFVDFGSEVRGPEVGISALWRIRD